MACPFSNLPAIENNRERYKDVIIQRRKRGMLPKSFSLL